MSDAEKMIFSANELIAISTALQAQIEDCQEYLHGSDYRRERNRKRTGGDCHLEGQRQER